MARIGRKTEPRVKVGDRVAIMPDGPDPEAHEIEYGVVREVESSRTGYTYLRVRVLVLTEGGRALPADGRRMLDTLDAHLSVLPLDLLAQVED